AVVEVGSVERFFWRLGVLAAHPGGGKLDGLEDLDVPGAAAQVARQGFFDLLARRRRLFFQERLRRQEESRRAIAALRGAEVRKGLLEWMESLPPRHAFHRLNVSAFALDAEVQTGENRPFVYEHGAGAAFPELAAVLRARQAQVLAQDLEKRLVRREGGLDGLAVDAEGNERRVLGIG